MFEAFNKQSKLVRVLLLLIPVVNWITELVVRLDLYSKKKNTANLIVVILSILPIGVAIGFIDCLALLLTDKMILID